MGNKYRYVQVIAKIGQHVLTSLMIHLYTVDKKHYLNSSSMASGETLTLGQVASDSGHGVEVTDSL